MRTFRQVYEEKSADRIFTELTRADRSYQRDNLDPSSGGRYLDDFLQAHGDEPARAIKFFPGSPHAAGKGVIFIPQPWACHECGGKGDRLSMPDYEEKTVHITCTAHNRYEVISWEDAILHYPEELKKMRRQLEDRLRKNPVAILAAESFMWKADTTI